MGESFHPATARPPLYPGLQVRRRKSMITTRCVTLSLSCRGSCCPLLWGFRVVVMLAVLVLVVVLALRGYPPGSVVGPLLVLAAGTVAAADRLVGVQGARAVSALAL
jgi:hypothetical protein